MKGFFDRRILYTRIAGQMSLYYILHIHQAIVLELRRDPITILTPNVV